MRFDLVLQLPTDALRTSTDTCRVHTVSPRALQRLRGMDTQHAGSARAQKHTQSQCAHRHAWPWPASTAQYPPKRAVRAAGGVAARAAAVMLAVQCARFPGMAPWSVIRMLARCNQKWYAYHFSGIYHFWGGGAGVSRRGIFLGVFGWILGMFDGYWVSCGLLSAELMLG